MAAHDELSGAVDGLVEPVRVRIERDRGPGEWATLPSVYEQLVDAVGHGIESTLGSRAAGGRLPVSADVLDQLDRIRIAVADWTALYAASDHAPAAPALCPELPAWVRRSGNVPRDLRRLAAMHYPDPALPAQLARMVTRWTHAAESLLAGDAGVRDIRGVDCPRCRYGRLVDDVDGRQVASWPLRVDLRRGLVYGVRCRLCWTYWERQGDQLGTLAGELVDARRTA